MPFPLSPVAQRSISTKVDRKSTRLNSSHSQISYAVFCLKKKIYTHGDIAALASQPTTHPLQDRLVLTARKPHSVPPVEVFPHGDPEHRHKPLFRQYPLDT